MSSSPLPTVTDKLSAAHGCAGDWTSAADDARVSVNLDPRYTKGESTRARKPHHPLTKDGTKLAQSSRIRKKSFHRNFMFLRGNNRTSYARGRDILDRDHPRYRSLAISVFRDVCAMYIPNRPRPSHATVPALAISMFRLRPPRDAYYALHMFITRLTFFYLVPV